MPAINALNTVALMGHELTVPEWIAFGLLAFLVFSVFGHAVKLFRSFLSLKKKEEEEDGYC